MGTKLAVLAGLLLAGCSGAAQDDLDSARHLWTSARPTAYETVVRRSCYCANVDPYRVQVDGAAVTSAVRLSPDGVETPIDPADYPSWFTVEGLFTVVQDAIDQHVDRLETQYDDRLGHPLHIAIDPHAGTSDDETTYEVARLDAL